MKAGTTPLAPEVQVLDALGHAQEKAPLGASIVAHIEDEALWLQVLALIPADGTSPKAIPHIITCVTGQRIGFKTHLETRTVSAHRLPLFLKLAQGDAHAF